MRGEPEGRAWLIEKAIAALQSRPGDALAGEFFGIKNYAGFGDQRCDCPYHMGPKHGDIVFKIGRRGSTGDERRAVEVTDDAVYLLEAVRDFGSVEHPCGDPRPGTRNPKRVNLCDLLEEIGATEDRLLSLRKVLIGATVSSHEEECGEAEQATA